MPARKSAQVSPAAVIFCLMHTSVATESLWEEMVAVELRGHCMKPEGFPVGASEHVAPRPFWMVCSTPSSAHFLMDARGVVYNGRDEDEITMDIISQGPLPWSVSRFNQGDFAPRLGPKWQASQTNLGVKASLGGSSQDYADAHSSQAWAPHHDYGIVLPTVAKNGQDWGDGLFYGTAAIAPGGGGFGYSMADGSFGQGGCDVIVGKAGGQKEANIDVAVSWIPYAAGFPSGFVAAPHPGRPAAWLTPDAHSLLLPHEAWKVVDWRWGRPTGGNHSVVTLPGYTARDGMFFAAATDGGMKNNDLNIVTVRPTEDYSGWQVQVHEDFDPTRFQLAPMYQWMFCFLFVPFKGVANLHAAHVNGVTGAAATVGAVEVKRVRKGAYLLRLLGKGPLDGVWLLQCAGEHTVVPGTMNAFISYEWDERAEAFMVEVRHVSSLMPPLESSDVPRPRLDEAAVDERFPPSEADFFAVWMDHRNPPIMAVEAALGGSSSSLTASQDEGHRHLFTTGFFMGVTASLCGVLLLQALRGWRREGGARALFETPAGDSEGLVAPL